MNRQDPIHPDYREFALSIADFALLYDPRDRQSVTEFKESTGIGADNTVDVTDVPAGDNLGMQRLYCEALWRRSPFILGQICSNPAVKDFANNSWFMDGDVPPAWIAGGINRDDIHKSRYHGDIVVENKPGINEVADLKEHIIDYRQKAAGMFGQGKGDDVTSMAKPIAPPERPESISVDHHDPYLVNYRNAPIPLRVGDKDGDNELSNDCAPKVMSRQGDQDSGTSEVVEALENGTFEECSIDYQIAGDLGDMSRALSSRPGPDPETSQGDPETPVLEAYQDERILFRMIQGAQEVQHSFMIHGKSHKRNIDQAFSQGMQDLGMTDDAANTVRQDCFDRVREGRPSEYLAWSDTAPADLASKAVDLSFWQDYEKTLAECDNIEGFTFAQEIGISEHFEIRGSLRSDVSQSLEFVLADDDASARPIPESDDSGPTDLSDYLYSFGTIDALWNGAWGLLRIFENETAIDPNTGEPWDDTEGEEIGGRVLPLKEPQLADETVALDLAGLETNGGLSCPLPRPDRPLDITEAVIVALETREIWSRARRHRLWRAASRSGWVDVRIAGAGGSGRWRHRCSGLEHARQAFRAPESRGGLHGRSGADGSARAGWQLCSPSLRQSIGRRCCRWSP